MNKILSGSRERTSQKSCRTPHCWGNMLHELDLLKGEDGILTRYLLFWWEVAYTIQSNHCQIGQWLNALSINAIFKELYVTKKLGGFLSKDEMTNFGVSTKGKHTWLQTLTNTCLYSVVSPALQESHFFHQWVDLRQ